MSTPGSGGRCEKNAGNFSGGYFSSRPFLCLGGRKFPQIALQIAPICDIIAHMPILKNAKKALRNSERKRVVNRQVKTRVKTFTDKVKKSHDVKDVPAAFSAIDKAVKNILIHRNQAARLKAQMARLAASK